MKTLREYLDQLDEIDRRGFLKGIGAAAVAGAAGSVKAQNKQFTPEQIETIRLGLALWIRYKDINIDLKPYPQRLKNAIKNISKLPGGKEVIETHYSQLRKLYSGLSEEEKSNWSSIDATRIVRELEGMTEFNLSQQPSDTQLTSWKDQTRTAMMREEDLEEASPDAVKRIEQLVRYK